MSWEKCPACGGSEEGCCVCEHSGKVQTEWLDSLPMESPTVPAYTVNVRRCDRCSNPDNHPVIARQLRGLDGNSWLDKDWLCPDCEFTLETLGRTADGLTQTPERRALVPMLIINGIQKLRPQFDCGR